MGLAKDIIYNNYNSKIGIEQTTPGWYSKTLYIEGTSETLEKHEQILEWMYDRLDNCEKHCRWMYNGNFLHYKFRYERDYIWFNLTWG